MTDKPIYYDVQEELDDIHSRLDRIEQKLDQVIEWQEELKRRAESLLQD